ncbi:aminotransferase class V-fold PLP-dependent enzyme [Gordonia zhaorongruii]|uniref:aminotransferase class V-fold PLP-dependent enzyme n=1 Tax=Gordonia zhaorongruii TaxID=2597659 RepID=UPI001045AC33|nr:aminotransferase class V-fold PLP-dependent enzyme [Gordonia zhaorongruii]
MTAILDGPVRRAHPVLALAPVVGAEVTVPTTGNSPSRSRTDLKCPDVKYADVKYADVQYAEVKYANLDYAASAPALTVVAEQIADALAEYASVHRGAGHLSQVTTARYERAREVIREFVGGRADDSVIFTRNTTDSINLAATVVPGDVVVLDIEHHANLLPWTGRARVVESKPTVDETLAALDAELASAPAALLAVTAASNVTGEVLPIGRLTGLAHRHGARILVDGAQLVPHRGVSVAGFGIDYLVFSGHKLYAPFGAGVLVGRGDWLDAAPPYLAGGGASAQVAVDDVSWHTGPARHEAGSPNVLGAVSIASAAEALCDIGFESIGAHDEVLVRRFDEGLAALGHVRPLRIFDDHADRVGIASFAVDGHTPRQVAEFLSERHGIGVRDGKFCAHPLLTKLGRPDGAVRASFGVGTTSDDIDRLLAALAELG